MNRWFFWSPGTMMGNSHFIAILLFISLIKLQDTVTSIAARQMYNMSRCRTKEGVQKINILKLFFSLFSLWEVALAQYNKLLFSINLNLLRKFIFFVELHCSQTSKSRIGICKDYAHVYIKYTAKKTKQQASQTRSSTSMW